MKLTKINLNQPANANLNEREMCRLLGGGEPGCCQCGCHGSSTTSSNDRANNAGGLTSDPGATTPCDDTTEPPTSPSPSPPPQNNCYCTPVDVTCGVKNW
jgi:natural product precursor